MGARPNTPGLCPESMDTGVHRPGTNIGHSNCGMFDASVCEEHYLGVLPPLFQGLPGLTLAIP